jgi:hypothetical protein
MQHLPNPSQQETLAKMAAADKDLEVDVHNILDAAGATPWHPHDDTADWMLIH